MMFDGKVLLYFIWFIMILSLFFFIPKGKIHLALLAFLFKQLLTWPLGLYVVNMGWIQYPVRFFENANYASFTFEYFAYPLLCTYFNIYFPVGKSLFIRVMYYTFFCTLMTLFELLVLHYTDLIRYIHWNAYLTWITLFITFFL